MKLTKRLFAILIAVMLVAAVAVTSVSAAASIPSGDCTLTINGLKDFTASVYKIADFNATTGAYSNFKTDAIGTAVKAGFTGTGYTPDAALLTAAKDAYDNDQLGAAVKTAAFTSDTTISYTDIAPGVYFVKWTAYPATATKMQDSVLALPYYNQTGDAWVTTAAIDSKVATDAITYNKVFNTTAESSKDVVTRSIGDDVLFKLSGSVPGSSEVKATQFWFNDVMSEGLILKTDDITVKAFTAGDSTGTALTAGTGYEKTVAADNKSFKINFTTAQINALYTAAYKNIEITYTAKLDANGVVIAGDGNKNTLTYHYLIGSTPFNGEKVKTVKTYEFSVKKTDATTGEALNGATFKLYSTDACADSDLMKTVETAGADAAKGMAKFSGLKQGTYYVKETAAPAGYALNSAVFAVSISETGEITGADVADGVLTVKDPKIILPNTGGNGTMIFTIIGIALIAGAAVLFVIYKKKTAAK